MNNTLDFFHALAAYSIRHLIYFIIVAVAAFSVGHFVHTNQYYWMVWSALFLSLITSGDTLKSRLVIILLTGFAASLSAFFASCFASMAPLLAIYLFLLTMVSVWLGQRYAHYFYPAFIVVLFAILAGGLQTGFHEAAISFIYMLLGLLIALIPQVIFCFHFTQKECEWFAILSLWQLKKLNNDIFSCFLQPEYPDNIYLYERRLHLQKNKCLNALGQLRNLASKENDQMIFFQKKLDKLFDCLLDCSQLRRRVSDHATFVICAKELTAISQEIDRLFGGLIVLMLGKKLFPLVNMLDNKIAQLEESYNNVLQISAREPLVFLLFIFSLKTLSEEIAKCYEIYIHETA